LLAIVKNPAAAYIERNHAAEALVASNVDIDWAAVVETLQTRPDDKRLALEIIALTRGEGFSGGQIAAAILAYKKPSGDPTVEGDSDDEPYVSGMVYGIKRRITPQKSGEILDEIASRIEQQKKSAHWRPGYELSNGIHELVEKAIEDNHIPKPERVWSWLKLTEGERSYSSERRRPIHDWLMQNPNLRREIQKIALSDGSIDGGPWMAIVHDLPTVNRALALSVTDVAEFLTEVGSKDTLGNFDIELWAALIRSRQISDGIPEEVQISADIGIHRHSVLEGQWRELTSPPKRDWRKEEKERNEDRQQKRTRKFAKHRASFWPIKEKIASGEEIGALKQIANAYLGRYSDLDREDQPDGRVREWLGNELTSAALSGFVCALSRNDMPSAQQIAETHAEGKEWNLESVLVSGIAELVRSGRSLSARASPL
jgi:hypothetical protein